MNNIIFFKLHSLVHQSNFLDWLIFFTAETFGYIAVFLIFVYLIFHKDGVFDYKKPFLQIKHTLRELFFVFFSSFTAWFLSVIMKSLIEKPRPFLFFENVKPLFVYGGVDSFPSSHAMFFGALAFSIFLIHKRLGILYIIIALLVGLARVASGIHFPVDIFFGYIFGVIVAIIFRYIFKLK